MIWDTAFAGLLLAQWFEMPRFSAWLLSYGMGSLKAGSIYFGSVCWAATLKTLYFTSHERRPAALPTNSRATMFESSKNPSLFIVVSIKYAGIGHVLRDMIRAIIKELTIGEGSQFISEQLSIGLILTFEDDVDSRQSRIFDLLIIILKINDRVEAML